MCGEAAASINRQHHARAMSRLCCLQREAAGA
jgi:hypothetical protein